MYVKFTVGNQPNTHTLGSLTWSTTHTIEEQRHLVLFNLSLILVIDSMTLRV